MIETYGYAAQDSKSNLAPYTFQRRDVGENDVLIDIHFCGICHSDIHQARNEWGGTYYPVVPGHEIAGKVSRVGSKVTRFKVGDTVGVGCIVDSCRTCTSCQQGLQQYCLEGMIGTYSSLERDKKSITQGGYSNRIVVDQNYVLKMPQSLPLDAAAPLLCAGITLYSPLKHWNAGPGKKVAIVGLGGLGHMGVKIAKAMGAEVTVLSHSDKKKEDAKRLGAHHFYASSKEETFTQLESSFDLIINTVSAQIDWNAYLNLLKIDGSMVNVGAPEKPVPVSVFSLISGRKSLCGSLIGGIPETQEMLDFCEKHQLTCDIEKISIQKVNEAYERVLSSDVRYRFVIDMATLTQTVSQ